MREKLATLQASPPGRFFQKFNGDRGFDLAVLLAWGTLNTLFPVLLGITALAGLLLNDPERLSQIQGVMLALFPGEESRKLLGGILDDTRKSAGAVGLVGLLLLLVNGSGFFGNLQMVFNQAYGAPERNFVMQRVVSLVMLVLVTTLLVLSTTAYSLGGVLAAGSDALFSVLPFDVPGRGALGAATGWSVSIVSAVAMFFLLYRILPNKPQTLKQTIPGALVAAVLFFLILQLFPLYLTFFGKSFQTYAVFGTFLLLMFWAYLMGIVLVLGAELNAFLEGASAVAAGRDAALGLAPSTPPVQGPPVMAGGAKPALSGVKGRLVGILGVLVAALLLRRRAA